MKICYIQFSCFIFILCVFQLTHKSLLWGYKGSMWRRESRSQSFPSFIEVSLSNTLGPACLRLTAPSCSQFFHPSVNICECNLAKVVEIKFPSEWPFKQSYGSSPVLLMKLNPDSLSHIRHEVCSFTDLHMVCFPTIFQVKQSKSTWFISCS